MASSFIALSLSRPMARASLVPLEGGGELVGDISRRLVVEPVAQVGVLVVGGGQIVGSEDRRLRQPVDGHGLLPTPAQRIDQGVEGIPAVGAVAAVSDLPSWVLGCGHIQVVGQAAPGELGVAGLLEQAVAPEAEGVVHGDPLGAEHGQGVAEAGRVLDIALREDGSSSVVELDHELRLHARYSSRSAPLSHWSWQRHPPGGERHPPWSQR